MLEKIVIPVSRPVNARTAAVVLKTLKHTGWYFDEDCLYITEETDPRIITKLRLQL